MVALLALLAACDGINGGWRAAAVDECLSIVDSTGGKVLVGEAGARELCTCAADSVQARYPDAAERWAEYQEEVDKRFEERGLIGLTADTGWVNNRGAEMAMFAAGFVKTIATCTELTVQTSVNGIPR